MKSIIFYDNIHMLLKLAGVGIFIWIILAGMELEPSSQTYESPHPCLQEWDFYMDGSVNASSEAAAHLPFSSRKTAPISSGDFKIPEGRK